MTMGEILFSISTMEFCYTQVNTITIQKIQFCFQTKTFTVLDQKYFIFEGKCIILIFLIGSTQHESSDPSSEIPHQCSGQCHWHCCYERLWRRVAKTSEFHLRNGKKIFLLIIYLIGLWVLLLLRVNNSISSRVSLDVHVIQVRIISHSINISSLNKYCVQVCGLHKHWK